MPKETALRPGNAPPEHSQTSPGAPGNAISSGDSARELLMMAAEIVFTEQGIDGASLREIARRAGQQNSSALHYHFGSRGELLKTIMQRRIADNDQRRVAFFHAMEAAGKPLTIRDVVEGIVLPIADLQKSPTDRHALLFLASNLIRPEFDFGSFVIGKHEAGFMLVRQYARSLLPNLPEKILRQRIEWIRTSVLFSLAEIEAQRTRLERQGRVFDLTRAHKQLVDTYISTLTGLLPLAPEVNEQAPTQ